MTYHIDIQHACAGSVPVTDEMITQWATAALIRHKNAAELTIRLVNPEEITSLNSTYRKKSKATNVLAFPSTLPEEIMQEYPLLGDIIICPLVLKGESEALNKPIEAHWAHIVIHGVLHLLGYDHIEDQAAEVMQILETQLLSKFGYEDPYYTSVEG